VTNVLQVARERALVLCAHTDDEFGCAGTVIRLVEAGVRVRYIAVSRCEESVPDGLPKDVLEEECRRCTARMGLAPEDVEVWRYPVRRFPQFRQEILEDFVKVARSFRPELVLLPSSDDTHQDHRTVYEEGFRAFKHATLFGYELPQNLISFSNSCFVALSEAHLERKVAALTEYRSQAFRSYAAGEFIRSLAQVRGVQSNVGMAEAFEAVRLVLK
jgi:LmbE family N-acetylglucosaminyl deacetylase